VATYTINGQEINTIDEGPTNRQKAILLHGPSSSSYALSPLIGPLSQRFSCISIDLPDYGKSPPLLERATIPGYAELLANFIEELSDGPVVLGIDSDQILALAVDDPVLGNQLLWNIARAMSQTARFIIWQLNRAKQSR
jgi:pimeloyl-ACP methyl ester carboxylesterase